MTTLSHRQDTGARLDTPTSGGDASQPSSPSETAGTTSAPSSSRACMQHTDLFIPDPPPFTLLTPTQPQLLLLLHRAVGSDDAIARHTDKSQVRSVRSASESNISNIASQAFAETTHYPRSAAASASSASRSSVAVAIGVLSEEACLEELYGPTAKSEEDFTLQVGLELAARRKQSIQQSTQTSTGLSSGMSGMIAGSERDLEGNDEDEVNLEHDLDDDQKDHCLSGICLPSSQFFQTSVICSNTMTRDGLANERTFLSWLSVSMSLCLVSFSFITRALTLDTITDQGDDSSAHKDKLSRRIGYVCFGCAFFAAIYSMLKYLRNIRLISTRYPFVQAGPWTFTIGMILAVLIMVALTLAYTENI